MWGEKGGRCEWRGLRTTVSRGNQAFTKTYLYLATGATQGCEILRRKENEVDAVSVLDMRLSLETTGSSENHRKRSDLLRKGAAKPTPRKVKM
jgi:hypothetical protein